MMWQPCHMPRQTNRFRRNKHYARQSACPWPTSPFAFLVGIGLLEGVTLWVLERLLAPTSRRSMSNGLRHTGLARNPQAVVGCLSR